MSSEHSILFVFFFYTLSAIAALFWGIFLFLRRKKSHQNLYFGIIFFVIGLLYLRNSFFRLPVIEVCNIYNPLSYFVLIFIAPFTLYYINFAIGQRHSIRRNLTHFIPFVFLGLLWIILKIFSIPQVPSCRTFRELLESIQQYPLSVGFFFLMMLTFIGQVFTYCIFALNKFRQIGKQYKKRGISRRPVNILITMDVLFFVYTMACIVFMSNKNQLSMGGASFHFFVTVVISLIASLNLNLKLPLKRFPISDPKEKKAIVGDVPKARKDVYVQKEETADRQLASKIAVAFEQEEIFRDPELLLQDLAVKLGTNRTYVSNCINRQFGCNFNQLIIHYRINAAKELLLNSEMPIQKIILEVGFNTRSSFYEAFREKVCEDMSPSVWRKKYQGEYRNQ